MSNSKISTLTAATVPLAGTELLPVVQAGTTKNATVAQVLSGTNPSATATGVAYFNASNVLSTLSIFTFNGTGFAVGTAASSSYRIYGYGGTAAHAGRFYANMGATPTTGLDGYSIVLSGNLSNGSAECNIVYGVSGAGLWFNSWNGTTLTKQFIMDGSGNFTASTGNVVIGTAAKGINFTANTPAAGMTSQLLNWYEEGTWTPNQGAGLTLVGAFSSTGRYTRIGRQVSISGTVTGATSVAVAAAGVITSNLPFTVGTAGHGDATNAAVNASAAVICTGTSVTSAGGLLATGTITFSATYFV